MPKVKAFFHLNDENFVCYCLYKNFPLQVTATAMSARPVCTLGPAQQACQNSLPKQSQGTIAVMTVAPLIIKYPASVANTLQNDPSTSFSCDNR